MEIIMNHLTTTEEQTVLHPDLWALVGYIVTDGVMFKDWEYYEGAICLSWWILGRDNPYRTLN